jgi:hypothetical protein
MNALTDPQKGGDACAILAGRKFKYLALQVQREGGLNVCHGKEQGREKLLQSCHISAITIGCHREACLLPPSSLTEWLPLLLELGRLISGTPVSRQSMHMS